MVIYCRKKLNPGTMRWTEPPLVTNASPEHFNLLRCALKTLI